MDSAFPQRGGVLARLDWYGVVMPEGGPGQAALEQLLTQREGDRGLRHLLRGGGLVGYSISIREQEAERFVARLEQAGAAEGGDFAFVHGLGGAFVPVPPWLEQLAVVDGRHVVLAGDRIDAGPLAAYRLKVRD